ncbi:hypothetical protein KRMM14A1004_21580 [Krasilnikovia sp. MM14-A1004]
MPDGRWAVLRDNFGVDLTCGIRPAWGRRSVLDLLTSYERLRVIGRVVPGTIGTSASLRTLSAMAY